MKFEIKHRLSGKILFECETESFKLAVELAVKQEANLRYADLGSADLGSANLRSANLGSANLDFSSWPLHCGSFGVKADDRLVAQLFAHWARLDVSNCTPYVRYVHRFTCNQFGKYMANLFCEYRNDVGQI